MNKGLKTILIIVGIISIALAIVCFGHWNGSHVSWVDYGGDAYTGIQHASADTANNLQNLAEIIKIGFGSILTVIGCSLLGVGITVPAKKKEE